MIVWKGWGIGAFLIPLVCALLMQFGLDSFYYEGFYKAELWPLPLALCISAIPVLLVGYKLNNKPTKILVDQETNEQYELKPNHSLFWIPMQYWSGIVIALAIWMYLDRIGFIQYNS